ncbi:hypothetical protein TSOC111612_02230 [Tsukamurella ocularis]
MTATIRSAGTPKTIPKKIVIPASMSCAHSGVRAHSLSPDSASIGTVVMIRCYGKPDDRQ